VGEEQGGWREILPGSAAALSDRELTIRGRSGCADETENAFLADFAVA